MHMVCNVGVEKVVHIVVNAENTLVLGCTHMVMYLLAVVAVLVAVAVLLLFLSLFLCLLLSLSLGGHCHDNVAPLLFEAPPPLRVRIGTPPTDRIYIC